MLDPTKLTWLKNAAAEAAAAGHIWAQMAACEAALESNFGGSLLAREANNLFGMKQKLHPIYGTLSLPTREDMNGLWVTVDANWVQYPTIGDCFSDRMATLQRLRDVYPHYEMALTAPDEHTYVIEVSQTWSTDPQRAAHVIAIYEQYFLPQRPVLDAQDI